jgi:hypothetical protein
MKTIKRFFELMCSGTVVAAEHLCQCAKCSCNFDKTKAKQSDAGCECPNCKATLTQDGKAVEDQAAKEIKADGDVDAKNATRQPALEAGGPGSGPRPGGGKDYTKFENFSAQHKIMYPNATDAETEKAHQNYSAHVTGNELSQKSYEAHEAAVDHPTAENHDAAEVAGTQAAEHWKSIGNDRRAGLHQALADSHNKALHGANAKPAASLQAGFNGNQHKSAKELAAEHTTAADTASKVAASASKAARGQDPSNKEGLHDSAMTMHTAAKSLHELAAAKHRSAGEEDCAKDHDTAAAGHGDEIQAHKGVIEACGGMAKTAPAATAAALASDATPAAGFQLDCSACVEAKNFKSVLNPIADGILMYMPAGTHTITPSQNGRPVTVSVAIDAGAADRLESQRKSLEASGKKPFFSVQHSTQIAAFWPAEFFWDTRLDATGALVEGVWARGAWTRAGREAVEGKDFRTFSPTFFVDAIRNDPNRPVQVVCNNEAKANMGALENDAAFQSISPLWAHDASAPGTPKPKPEGVTTEKLIVMVHDELRASNPDLQDVVNALSFKYDMRVNANDVARALRGEALEAGGPGSGPHKGEGSFIIVKPNIEGGDVKRLDKKEYADYLTQRATEASSKAEDTKDVFDHAEAKSAHDSAAMGQRKWGSESAAKDHEEKSKYHWGKVTNHFDPK